MPGKKKYEKKVLLCPYCNEDAKYTGVIVSGPFEKIRVYTCIMGHEFYSVEHIPNNLERAERVYKYVEDKVKEAWMIQRARNMKKGTEAMKKLHLRNIRHREAVKHKAEYVKRYNVEYYEAHKKELIVKNVVRKRERMRELYDNAEPPYRVLKPAEQKEYYRIIEDIEEEIPF